MTLFKNNGKSNGTKSGGDAVLNLKRIAFGAVFGIILFSVLLVLFSLVLTFASVPDDCSVVFAFLSVAAASFFAGFVSLWKIGSGGLVNGLICGCILAVLHLAFSLIFGEGGRFIYVILSVAAEIVLATFGGIVSVNVKSK